MRIITVPESSVIDTAFAHSQNFGAVSRHYRVEIGDDLPALNGSLHLGPVCSREQTVVLLFQFSDFGLSGEFVFLTGSQSAEELVEEFYQHIGIIPGSHFSEHLLFGPYVACSTRFRWTSDSTIDFLKPERSLFDDALFGVSVSDLFARMVRTVGIESNRPHREVADELFFQILVCMQRYSPFANCEYSFYEYFFAHSEIGALVSTRQLYHFVSMQVLDIIAWSPELQVSPELFAALFAEIVSDSELCYQLAHARFLSAGLLVPQSLS